MPWPSRSLLLALAVLGLFTALTAAMTYPQMWRMTDGVNDPGDPLLNAWALSWIAHQLPRAPLRLFDGNIFFPETTTLAYSETLLAPGVVVAPLHWLGAGPILVYNLVFVSGFILSGAGMTLLVRRLTGNTGASIVAGVIFAFQPFRFDHYPQLQLQQAQWIPLSLWALHRLMDDGRLHNGLLLGLFVACQLLSCMYYGVFLACYLVVVGGVLMLMNLHRARARIAGLAAGAALAATLLAPAGIAYLSARQVVGERGAEEASALSARGRHFLAAPASNKLYGWTAARFGRDNRRLFPGVMAVVLAAVAVWPPWSTIRALYLLGLIFSIDLTLGFHGYAFPFLRDHVVVFRALRAPALAAMLVGSSLAVLAGFGVARVSSRFRSAHASAALVLCICAVCTRREPVQSTRAGDDSQPAARHLRRPSARRRHGTAGSDRRDPPVPRRADAHVLLDVPLAASAQRVQRILSARVRPAGVGDGGVSGRDVAGGIA